MLLFSSYCACLEDPARNSGGVQTLRAKVILNVIHSDSECYSSSSEYAVLKQKRSQVPRLCSEQAPYRDLWRPTRQDRGSQVALWLYEFPFLVLGKACAKKTMSELYGAWASLRKAMLEIKIEHEVNHQVCPWFVMFEGARNQSTSSSNS